MASSETGTAPDEDISERCLVLHDHNFAQRGEATVTLEGGRREPTNEPKDNEIAETEEERGSLIVDAQASEAPSEVVEVMGIENIWSEDDTFVSSPPVDYHIPLPSPAGYDDVSCSDQQGGAHESSNRFNSHDFDSIFSSETEPSADVRVPGVCGLRNLGNTCFMSAGLQCLVATPSIAQYFLTRSPPLAYGLSIGLGLGESRSPWTCDEADNLTTQFSLLLRKMWSGQFNVVQPHDFKQALAASHPQFKDFRQHDCQEFLALLLDTLHEQLNAAGTKSIHSDMSIDLARPQSRLEREGPSVEETGKQTLVNEYVMQVAGPSENSLSSQCSSPHSSEASSNMELRTAAANMLRMRPLPENVSPFKFVVPDAGTGSKPDFSGEVRDLGDGVSNANSRFTPDFDDGENSGKDVSSAPINNGGIIRNICTPVRGHVVKSTNVESEGKDSQSGCDTVQSSCGHLADACDEDCKPLDKNEVASHNNKNVMAVSPRLRGLEDILKDAKTSNVNVLVSEEDVLKNNEIKFDSEKYPRFEHVRQRNNVVENINFTEYHNFDGKSVSVKRIKQTNLLTQAGGRSEDCGDSASTQSAATAEDSDSECFNNIKRIRLEEQDEKNYRMEYERRLLGEAGDSDGSVGVCASMDASVESCSDEGVANNASLTGEATSNLDMPGSSSGRLPYRDAFALKEESEADRLWEKHLSANQSVVSDTFQGQLKSTVVCSSCKHVSVTYEPFMYLSVPLPHAMERQICVTYVPASGQQPTKFLLNLCKHDRIKQLKEKLVEVIGRKALPPVVAVAEVLEHHIARILDDSSLLRYVNDTNRTIYAFELLPLVLNKEGGKNAQDKIRGEGEPIDLAWPPSDQLSMQPSVGSGGEKGDCWRTCAICLEEKDFDLRRHRDCSCLLCEGCIERSCRHYGTETLTCPVCGVVVRPEEDFVSLDSQGECKQPKVRFLNVPVVFRLDTEGDGNNNKKTLQLFGHPRLVHLPSVIGGGDLYGAIEKLVPVAEPYSILFVDGQGYHCSRCMYARHCRGCRVPTDADVTIRHGDTLAVRFRDTDVSNLDALGVAEEHGSLRDLRRQDPLSLYDCLRAFSESEMLDEHNPWFCPECQQNQCATKTLSVWRCPDFLIVYLKRFVFQDCSSTKLDNRVTFPLSGLCMSPAVAGTHSLAAPSIYNLYACVCHFGGASAGHYTSYSKNPQTLEWHYFNDETVTKQKPHEEDYSNAYVLFYQREGPRYEVRVPEKMFSEDGKSNSSDMKPNIEQLIQDLDSAGEQENDKDDDFEGNGKEDSKDDDL